MEAFQRVKHVEKTQSEKQKDKRKKLWTPPPPPPPSMEAYAAIDVKAKVVGLGVVIRDDEGKIVVAATKPSRLICGVSIA